MTPEQEKEKLKAEERASRNFELGKCRNCDGYGFGVAGRFPTVVRCPVCNGTGKER